MGHVTRVFDDEAAGESAQGGHDARVLIFSAR
jgi:hypothetical protein